MPRDTPSLSLNLRKLRLVGFLAAAVAVAVVGTGILSRERSSARLRDWTDAQAIPSVAVVSPSAKALSPYLNLPGRLEAYSRAPIYARVSGYLKDWKVDIGARVKAGHLLAEIDAPDLDPGQSRDEDAAPFELTLEPRAPPHTSRAVVPRPTSRGAAARRGSAKDPCKGHERSHWHRRGDAWPWLRPGSRRLAVAW